MVSISLQTDLPSCFDQGFHLTVKDESLLDDLLLICMGPEFQRYLLQLFKDFPSLLLIMDHLQSLRTCWLGMSAKGRLRNEQGV